MLKKFLVVLFMGFLAWAYQAIQPPPPKICGSLDGPPVTAPRIKLRDGRNLAYKEFGVAKNVAKFKFIFVHGFDSCRLDAGAIVTYISPVCTYLLNLLLYAFMPLQSFLLLRVIKFLTS